jgi:hypothetical protein
VIELPTLDAGQQRECDRLASLYGVSSCTGDFEDNGDATVYFPGVTTRFMIKATQSPEERREPEKTKSTPATTKRTGTETATPIGDREDRRAARRAKHKHQAHGLFVTCHFVVLGLLIWWRLSGHMPLNTSPDTDPTYAGTTHILVASAVIGLLLGFRSAWPTTRPKKHDPVKQIIEKGMPVAGVVGFALGAIEHREGDRLG